jgi:hypothetical protein
MSCNLSTHIPSDASTDGQVETINQLMNAYFLITFTEWCWVWMDGIWSKCVGIECNLRILGQ